MSVLLDPATQLSFPRPFTQNVIRTLVVKNPNLEPIAFKVKTTAPKQYCVRPNSGRIEANQTVDVQVILQAMKEDPPPDYKCKDKFLVQSISIAPEQENLSLQDLWTITEKQAKGSIKENKIRCIYLPPITSIEVHYPQQPTSPSSQQNLLVDNHTNNNSDKRYSTDSDISNAIAFDSRSILSNITNGDYNNHKDDQKSSNKLNNNNNNNNNQNNQSEETNIDKLRRQLSEAQDEIKRLNHRIEEYKLETNIQSRQRNKIEQSLPNKNNTPSGIGISVKTQEKVPEGYYPFEVVIGAAIGAFIFGVLFF